LAFALATRSWILPQEWALTDEGIPADQPVFGAFALDTAMKYYMFALAVLTLAAAFTLWFIRSRRGREIVALRDNEGAARALGVPAVRRKVEAFMVAGALAGLGGSLLAHSRTLVAPTDFAATESISIVVMAVVGGIAVVSGPVIGAFLVVGVPAIAGLDATLTTGLQFALLILILFRPAGFISLLVPIRDWWVEEWGRRYGRDPDALPPREAPRKSPFSDAWTLDNLASASTPVEVNEDVPVLALSGVSKSYGGLRAVDGVDLEVRAGEAVAVIGPNGAGKTTMFEIASGFVRPDEGTVHLRGQEVTSRAPESRARAGMVRSFQNALLFPTMTVEETVRMALGRSRAGKQAPTVEEVLETAGLSAYADSTIATLPTGVRRMTELACDLALAPQILLLDEPSAGIAHTEIPGLVALLSQMRESLGLTLVVIDHDMNLLRGVADRFVAMELGQVIARGTADEVAADPRVIEAFLGGNTAAVERSSTAVVASAAQH
jgi:ABC-type branched-subunit amino acid transport system ATPase component